MNAKKIQYMAQVLERLPFNEFTSRDVFFYLRKTETDSRKRLSTGEIAARLKILKTLGLLEYEAQVWRKTNPR